jgi:hypothetical protein
VHIRYWWESWKESDYYEDQEVDGWIVLRWDLEILLGYVDWIDLAQDGD